MIDPNSSLIAFAGTRRVGSGSPLDTALQAHAYLTGEPKAQILVFDSETGHPVELDLRGTSHEVADRLKQRSQQAEPPAPGKGRPRLGVTAREVTLLPRHWDWLGTQAGGASVTLRKLVEQAMHQPSEDSQDKARREAAYRFMLAVAGNERGFEEVSRALFAGNDGQLKALTEAWPADVRDHLLTMLEPGCTAGVR